MRNFKPNPQASVSLAVTAVTQDMTIVASGADSLMITCEGTQTVRWKYNTGGASVTTDTPILPGMTYVVDLPHGTTKIAVIAAGAGSTLHLTPGTGS